MNGDRADRDDDREPIDTSQTLRGQLLQQIASALGVPVERFLTPENKEEGPSHVSTLKREPSEER